MAKNDIILLDGIIEQRLAEGFPSHDRGEVFEYLAFEQILKDYDFSREEIESGWVDGSDDGGIDGFFTIVNGHLLRDPESFGWPKKTATLDVMIITAKHHATFQQAPLHSLLATLPELFELSRDKADLKGKYSEAVLSARGLFLFAYRRLAAISPTVTFHFGYASRGDTKEIGQNVAARSEQIVALSGSMFSSSRASFNFFGATELVTLYRRAKTFSLSLPFVEYLSRSGDSYVALTTLGEYVRFVTDENGHLRRYLFDSNVRDYLGDNRVNEDITASLTDQNGPEFWWLNNGVTILATAATVLGKVIQLQDVQIVNGLQTTESIFRHFSAGHPVSFDKGLLVKVIVSTDTVVRDQIIRATNNQSLVEPQSLHATDKIQRDIEEILERNGWFYERRRNYYRNIGKPLARFVTPMYIAGGYVSLILRNPALASRLKSRFMRNPISYGMVFSEETALEVWPAITEVLKRVEEVLEAKRPTGYPSDRFLARNRTGLALLAVARALGTFSYSISDFIALDKSILTPEFLSETWDARGAARSGEDKAIRAACERVAKAYKLSGLETLGRRTFAMGPPKDGAPGKPSKLDLDLVEVVNKALPPQPWKQGIHRELAAKLGVKPGEVSRAIEELFARGTWPRQQGGVVYDTDGKVLLERTEESKSKLG